MPTAFASTRNGQENAPNSPPPRSNAAPPYPNRYPTLVSVSKHARRAYAPERLGRLFSAAFGRFVRCCHPRQNP